MSVQSSVDLQQFNTLAVPSEAEFFWSVDSEKELEEALVWARQKQQPVHVIGGGSNVILSKRINGLLLQPALLGKTIIKQNDKHVWLEVGAGENWHQLVSWCLLKRYYGLENLALIPGSVGAAPVQNIGAYGVELSDVFDSLKGIYQKTLVWQDITRVHCEFAYRDSVFKHRLKGEFIISSIILKLGKLPRVKFDYPGLREQLGSLESVSPQQLFDAVINVRRSKLPDPQVLPNAGSFFKNPLVDINVAKRLKQGFPDAKIFPQNNGLYKIAAGWLIDKAGLRGQKVYGLYVHQYQALVLTNPEACDAKEVLKAAEFIQKTVQTIFNIVLDIEPQTLGD